MLFSNTCLFSCHSSSLSLSVSLLLSLSLSLYFLSSTFIRHSVFPKLILLIFLFLRTVYFVYSCILFFILYILVFSILYSVYSRFCTLCLLGHMLSPWPDKNYQSINLSLVLSIRKQKTCGILNIAKNTVYTLQK